MQADDFIHRLDQVPLPGEGVQALDVEQQVRIADPECRARLGLRLGLGHQLIEVSKRLQVKRIVLVELDQELVDWILPVIRPHVKKPLEVVVGDDDVAADGGVIVYVR